MRTNLAWYKIELFRAASLVLVLCLAYSYSAGFCTPTSAEPNYLLFQIFTLNGDAAPPNPVQRQPSKAELAATVTDIVTTIGTTGDNRSHLGFSVGPIAFDNSDEQVERLINDCFQIALEKNVAVCFHLDDSMFWATRKDLLSDPKNIEWLDWQMTPCTGRRID
jgi:hypothetical protein